MNEPLYDLRLAANGRVYSSLTTETLRRWVAEKRVLPHDFVKRTNDGQWAKVADWPELAVVLEIGSLDTPPTQPPARPAASRNVLPSAAGPSGATPSRPSTPSSAAGNSTNRFAMDSSSRPTPAKPPSRPPGAVGLGSHGISPTVENDLGIAEPTHRRPRRVRPKLEDSVMDMTPMIDVTFQLLIFFMFANQMANPSPIEAPEALYGKGVMPDGTQALLIDADGNYYLGPNARPEAIAPLDTVIAEVQKNAEVAPAPLEVIITAHKQAKHVQVRELVEQLENVDGIGPVHLGVEEKR
ncbi:MAG: biopolymer transporter ExbD [Planctomycetales bacterium]|nr:biopolymer transporter ExbD [Planctomycetales bacterium]